MPKSLLPTYSIKSKRILLSDKHYHKVELNELEMGVIQHALYTLHHAFVSEPEHLELIDNARRAIHEELQRPAYTDPLSSPR